MVHSMTNILLFTICLIYFIHYSACIFACLSYLNPNPLSKDTWIYSDIFKNSTSEYYTLNDSDRYVASVYLLIETFTTIGYGDINPKNITEVIFIMICQLLSLGLFAYLISCIIDFISRMTTHEISFKIQSDVDINSWLLKYNNKVPEMLKIKMEREHPGLFEEVKKYFIFYYKNDNLWIKNFDFLRKMRPDIKNKIISHTFFPLLSTFSYFFSDLEANFKYKIALNLKSKIIEKQEMIISEKNSNPKNKIKYIYFIGKGLVSIRKDDKEICLYESGGYFGDEYFLSETAQFTYKNASDSDMFLFCCPIEIIKEMCVNYEESFLILLIKTLIRFSRIRHEAEIFGLKFEDKNKEFFSKIHQNINKKIETKKRY